MFIKDPSPMEDGYKSLNIRNIVDSTFAPYKTMNDFVGNIGDCGPVAATNLMIMAKHSFGEDVLLDGTIKNVYDELFKTTDVIPRMEHTLIFCLLVLISILQVLIKNIQVQQENFSL